MNVLFEPYKFAGIKLRNRFVRSATVNNLTNEENLISREIHRVHIDLPRGGLGLIRERPRCVVTTREDGTPREKG